MALKFNLIALLLHFESILVLQANCQQSKLEALANEGNCDFYLEMEKLKQCGPTGYLINYGYKYCNKFGQYAYQFNQDVIPNSS